MQTGFAIDPRQRLEAEREQELVRLGADLGYDSAWTPAGPDESAFERCLRWHRASGLEVGISVVPASGRDPAFYANEAIRVWEGTGGRFVLGVGSGRMAHPAEEMRAYLEEMRRWLPVGLPVYVAALGPRMLRLAAELADGVALNWCTPEQVIWSRRIVEEAAAGAGKPTPRIVSYIRTCVAPDPEQARTCLGQAALEYALGPSAYRRHFKRMGFGPELQRLEADGGQPSSAFLAAAGAAGGPGQVRGQFLRLAQGLDLAIVRLLAVVPGDAASVRLALEECRPG